MKKITLLASMALFAIGSYAYAQDGRLGINTASPTSTLDISGLRDSNGNLITTDIAGLQAPRLTRAELTAKGNALYGANQKGTLIYITDVTGGDAASQRVNITTAGYYYFDGVAWQKLNINLAKDITEDEWVNNTTDGLVEVGKNADGAARTSGTEVIVRDNGQVLLGTTAVPTGGTNAKLIINNKTTNGAIQIKDGTDSNGKILTSDANGVATWKKPISQYYGASWSLATRPATNANIPIKFDNPTSIVGLTYSTATGLIDIKKTGWYLVTYRINGAPEATSAVDFYKKVGAINTRLIETNNIGSLGFGSNVVFLNAGEQAYFAFRENHAACINCGQSISITLISK